MCTSFHEASRELCDSVAAIAHCLCTSFVDPDALKGLTSSRLIALDKQPGVRPVGVGEVSRRTMGKAILSVIKEDILRAVGIKQLSVGQQSGVKQPYVQCRVYLNNHPVRQSCWQMPPMLSTT